MPDRVATNIRLAPAQLKELKRVALERGVRLSALFQELISEYLVRHRTLSGKAWQSDPFFQLGRPAARSGLTGVAEEHDRYLYPPRRGARARRPRARQDLR